MRNAVFVLVYLVYLVYSCLCIDDFQAVKPLKAFVQIKNQKGRTNGIRFLNYFMQHRYTWELVNNTDEADMIWTYKFSSSQLRSNQSVSRFAGVDFVHNKGEFKKMINQHCQINYIQDMKIIPITYKIDMRTPGLNHEEMQLFENTDKSIIWLKKPVQLSEARGFELITDLESFKQKILLLKPKVNQNFGYDGVSYLMQEYIKNPLLVGDSKIDVRVYIHIFSFDPIVAVYHFAYMRRCFRKFDAKNLKDLSIHVTNTPVQKKFNENLDDSVLFWDQIKFEKYLKHRFGQQKTELLFDKIKEKIAEALNAFRGYIDSRYFVKNRFQYLGVDVQIDNKLEPFLLEMNNDPYFVHTLPQIEPYQIKMVESIMNIQTKVHKNLNNLWNFFYDFKLQKDQSNLEIIYNEATDYKFRRKGKIDTSIIKYGNLKEKIDKIWIEKKTSQLNKASQTDDDDYL